MFLCRSQNATYTHCEVSNFAPSISASISHKPQKHLWQYCIALHTAPRFLFSYLLCHHLKARTVSGRWTLLRWLPTAALISQWIENASLLLLSVVSSVVRTR